MYVFFGGKIAVVLVECCFVCVRCNGVGVDSTSVMLCRRRSLNPITLSRLAMFVCALLALSHQTARKENDRYKLLFFRVVLAVVGLTEYHHIAA